MDIRLDLHLEGEQTFVGRPFTHKIDRLPDLHLAAQRQNFARLNPQLDFARDHLFE